MKGDRLRLEALVARMPLLEALRTIAAADSEQLLFFLEQYAERDAFDERPKPVVGTREPTLH